MIVLCYSIIRRFAGTLCALVYSSLQSKEAFYGIGIFLYALCRASLSSGWQRYAGAKHDRVNAPRLDQATATSSNKEPVQSGRCRTGQSDTPAERMGYTPPEPIDPDCAAPPLRSAPSDILSGTRKDNSKSKRTMGFERLAQSVSRHHGAGTSH